MESARSALDVYRESWLELTETVPTSVADWDELAKGVSGNGNGREREVDMETVTGVTQEGTTVLMDGKFFENCRFTRCTLIYHGGDFGWNASAWVDCTLQLTGPAARTKEILHHFGYSLHRAEKPSATPASTIIQ